MGPGWSQCWGLGDPGTPPLAGFRWPPVVAAPWLRPPPAPQGSPSPWGPCGNAGTQQHPLSPEPGGQQCCLCAHWVVTLTPHTRTPHSAHTHTEAQIHTQHRETDTHTPEHIHAAHTHIHTHTHSQPRSQPRSPTHPHAPTPPGLVLAAPTRYSQPPPGSCSPQPDGADMLTFAGRAARQCGRWRPRVPMAAPDRDVPCRPRAARPPTGAPAAVTAAPALGEPRDTAPAPRGAPAV